MKKWCVVTGTNTVLTQLVGALKQSDDVLIEALIEKLIQSRVSLNEDWLGISRVAYMACHPKLALSALAQFEPEPGSQSFVKKLAMMLECGDIANVESTLRALPLHAYTPAVLHFKATLKLQLGDFVQASASARQVLKSYPASGESWLNLVNADTSVTFNSAEYQQMRKLAESMSLRQAPPSQSLACLYSALSKLEFSAGEYDLAFLSAQRAASSDIRGNSYSFEQELKAADKLIKTTELPPFVPDPGQPEIKPIFIVGLPRSGTTLLEQALKGYSGTFGLGECETLTKAVAFVVGKAGQSAQSVAGEQNLTAEQRHQIKRLYIREVTALGGNFTQCIDKSLSNMWHVGLIKSLFPQSTIIHIERESLDSAWSCFRTHFSQGLEWSLDLGQIAEHFHIHYQLKEHWLSQSAVVPIQYADLVNKFEETMSKILRQLKVSEQPVKSNFHISEGLVKTASVSQVRQPISKTITGDGEAVKRQMEKFTLRFDALRGGKKTN
ncbi:sulfotransferase [Bowmanella sp. Y26]|uniref:sulfotransferase family protein n=1 Tax=Bowmanella yangjiangensis TaxID=2811230 RepID=UPI001BDBDC1A|nr:sulfotransferase [Bowmanella yangjiangensis]MBT1065654.1 sulfotransferase [Bowmanella yangjiangensis]